MLMIFLVFPSENIKYYNVCNCIPVFVKPSNFCGMLISCNCITNGLSPEFLIHVLQSFLFILTYASLVEQSFLFGFIHTYFSFNQVSNCRDHRHHYHQADWMVDWILIPETTIQRLLGTCKYVRLCKYSCLEQLYYIKLNRNLS